MTANTRSLSLPVQGMSCASCGHPDELALARVLWLCSLTLVAILVVPFFGLKGGGIVALVLLIVALTMCWGACGRKLIRGENQEGRSK